ncbi:hypothetical protein HHK36_013175 [Tetracentron sinense]|uniref:DUF7358 domain-containing protein n=1 Tax=Tetracentron sinense TaxID=13715 RepID=A0A835DG82_TETSI|nr:hypothetical protein HHK36_013175 [Tetracentron sinense]
MRVSKPRSLRWVALVSGVLNFVVVILGGFLMIMALTDCGRGKFIPFAIVSVAAGLRIMSMIGTGISQEATATTILSCPAESSFADAVIRHERRVGFQIPPSLEELRDETETSRFETPDITVILGTLLAQMQASYAHMQSHFQATQAQLQA